MRESRWRTRSSQLLFESPWFRLRQDAVTLPSGEDIVYTVIDHGGYVVVVPVLDDGRVVMERVYRHSVGRALLECPSGGLDGEDPLTAGRRELEEETGYRAGRIEHVAAFYGSPGISNERFDVCIARDLSDDGILCREPTEQIEVELVPLATLRERALGGDLEDGPTALAILLVAERLR